MSHSMAHSCNLKEKMALWTDMRRVEYINANQSGNSCSMRLLSTIHSYREHQWFRTCTLKGRCHTLVSDDAELTLTNENIIIGELVMIILKMISRQSALHTLRSTMFVSLTLCNANWCYSVQTTYHILKAF